MRKPISSRAPSIAARNIRSSSDDQVSMSHLVGAGGLTGRTQLGQRCFGVPLGRESLSQHLAPTTGFGIDPGIDAKGPAVVLAEHEPPGHDHIARAASDFCAPLVHPDPSDRPTRRNDSHVFPAERCPGRGSNPHSTLVEGGFKYRGDRPAGAGSYGAPCSVRVSRSLSPPRTDVVHTVRRIP